MRRILAIGAHADDIEVGCFGTLLKYRQWGDEIHIAVMTSGGYGERSDKTISAEMDLAMAELGPSSLTIFNSRVGHIRTDWETVSQIDALIESHGINTIFTISDCDTHQDHHEVARITAAACRHGKIDNLFAYEMATYVFTPKRAFKPHLFIDISSQFKNKIDAVSCYSCFQKKEIELVTKLASHRGSLVGVEYAESFEVLREVWR